MRVKGRVHRIYSSVRLCMLKRACNALTRYEKEADRGEDGFRHRASSRSDSRARRESDRLTYKCTNVSSSDPRPRNQRSQTLVAERDISRSPLYRSGPREYRRTRAQHSAHTRESEETPRANTRVHTHLYPPQSHTRTHTYVPRTHTRWATSREKEISATQHFTWRHVHTRTQDTHTHHIHILIPLTYIEDTLCGGHTALGGLDTFAHDFTNTYTDITNV